MNHFRKISVLVASSLLLSACATTTWHSNDHQVDPQMKSGNTKFVKAENVKNVRTKVINHYIPVAIPGQLTPIPSHQDLKPKKFLSKEAAVAYANKQAVQVPKSGDFFNAIMTYNYMPGALYTVYTKPMEITDIKLQKGEKIISVSAGDTLRWQISQTYSGEGANTQQYLLIKPNNANLTNSLFVTTNLRVYHFILHSLPVSSSTKNGAGYMISVQFNYPKSLVTFSHNDMQQAAETAMATTSDANAAYALNINDLNLNYRYSTIKGKKPSWFPVLVASSGRRTYIKFPKSFYNDSLPILFVANNEGKYGTSDVNWNLKGRVMIINGTFKAMRLQTGVKKVGETIVQIERTGS